MTSHTSTGYDYDLRVTPMGIIRYSHVVTPDTRFGAPQYSATLVLDRDNKAVQAWIKAVDKYFEAFLQSAKAEGLNIRGTRQPYDVKGDKIEVKFSQSASRIKNGEQLDFKVDIVDAQCEPLQLKAEIPMGATVALSYVISRYIMGGTAGLSFKLRAVQVIKMPNSGAKSYNSNTSVFKRYNIDDSATDTADEATTAPVPMLEPEITTHNNEALIEYERDDIDF